MRVPTQPQAGPSKEVTPLYADSVNMLEGLADEDVDRYLDENPRIVPLFKVYVAEAVSPYMVHTDDASEEPDGDAIRELRQAQEALEREMVISQWVKASQFKEVKLGTGEETRPVHVPKKCHQRRKVTIRNRYAVPLISILLERVNGAKFLQKSIYEAHITSCGSDRETNGRPPFAGGMGISSILLCHSI